MYNLKYVEMKTCVVTMMVAIQDNNNKTCAQTHITEVFCTMDEQIPEEYVAETLLLRSDICMGSQKPCQLLNAQQALRCAVVGMQNVQTHFIFYALISFRTPTKAHPNVCN